MSAWAPHKPCTEQNFKKLSSLIIYKQCTFNGFRRVKLIKKKEKKRKKIDWFFYAWDIKNQPIKDIL